MQQRLKFLRLWKLVQRENAARYLLISLLSFVASVTVVRIFLALTGYPQLGSGTLHIAHVLWGGLILYIAAILPLIYLNPRLHVICAILSGVGVGLFIDEVGKFITRQNDYFFPAAASIIYVFFLLVLILVVILRRPATMDGRAELVQALETVREQLYHPLEPAERAHMEKDLTKVLQSDESELHISLARYLLEFIQSDPRTLSEPRPTWWTRLSARLTPWQSERRLRLVLGVGMALLGLFTLKNPAQVWLEQRFPSSALVAFLGAQFGRQISAGEAPGLFKTRLMLEVLIGLLLLVAAGLLLVRKKRLAFMLGYFSLLLSLVVLDMLLFYFEQFSALVLVLFQFLLLFGVMYYRRKYLKTSG
jgi:hypothetical protein